MIPQLKEAAAPEPDTPPDPDAVDQSGGGVLTLGIVTASVGGVGLIVGSIFGILTFTTESAADDICPETNCATQDGLDKHDQAFTFSVVSTIGFVAGGVLAAAGILMIALAPGGEDGADSASLSIGPTPGGVMVNGTF